MGLRDDVQVWPFHRRAQIGTRGTNAAAILDCPLNVRDAFLLGTIVVRIPWNAALDTSFNKRFAEWMSPLKGRYRYGPFTATLGINARSDAVLCSPKIGENVRITPASITKLGPGIEIEALPTVVDVTVD